VLDVRRPAEWAGGTIPGASLVTLNELPRRLAAGGPGLPPREGPTAVVCQGGYRSSLAASLLMRAGWGPLWNVAGGMGAWQARGLPVETTAPARA